MGDYGIKNLYQGGYSSFSPKAYGSSLGNYKPAGAGSLGMTSDPRTANVLQDVSGKLNMGVKQIEVAAVNPAMFDSIPDQQLTELKRLGKLTGANISLHGPVMDVAGFNKEGFSEINREDAQRRIVQVLERSKQIDPNGSIPVTFHSADGMMGSQWKTLGDKDKPREEKILIAVEKDTGKMTPLKDENKYYPGGLKGEVKVTPISPKENLDLVNKTQWDDKISQLFFNKERADEILNKNHMQIAHLMEDVNSGQFDPANLRPAQKEAYIKFKDAENYLDDLNRNAKAIFSKAYEYGTPEQREILTEISKKYREDLGIDEREKEGKRAPDPIRESKAMHELLLALRNEELAPEMFVPIEKFATDQSAKTFGNAAFQVYKNAKDKNNIPTLCIENPPAGMGLSTGEDLRNLVEASRKQFIENAKKDGVSESEAKKAAEKFIGATWDVGHINMLRKEGFETKDVVKETEKIAPFVKHVHLSDNFGFEHTELPMGMGNVPIKEIMEKLGQNGFDAKKIIEASSWWEHFKTPPFRESLEAVGSPIYSAKMGPYWSQGQGFYQDYFPESGATLPQVNYETFGSNFSKLPMELGGQRGGAEGSRMSGRGME